MALTLQQSVSQLIRIAVANQPQYVYNELRKRGYSNPYQPPAGELESKLYELYASNKTDFYNLLEGLTFDPTRTDSIGSSAVLSSLAAEHGFQPELRITGKGVWDWIVGTIGGKEETVVDPITKIETKANIGAVIGLIVVAILAVVIVYVAFFRK